MTKLKSILAITASFLLITAGQKATAVPADPLLPILDDIQAVLPDGMVMRLPDQDAVDGVQDALYAWVKRTDEGEVRIDLGNVPNCPSRSCMRGYFSATPAGVEHPREVYVRNNEIGRAQITLAEGVVGHYITVRGIRRPHSIVLWKQDGQTYTVSVIPKYSSINGLTDHQAGRQRMLNFAISMANEPPLTKE